MIPQLLDLLSHRKSNDRRAGAEILSKFSEQGKVLKYALNVVDVLVAVFRETIRNCIPQIIVLLWNTDLDVRHSGADALLIISKQGNLSSFFI